MLIFSYSEITELQTLREAFPHLLDLKLHKVVVRNFINKNQSTQDPYIKVAVSISKLVLENV